MVDFMRQRRSSVCRVLKSAQSEHLVRLQQKSKQDIDVLEDLKDFLRRRAQVEAEYGQALQKLAFQFTQKAKYTDLHDPDHLAVSAVAMFKCIIRETDNEGASRQQLAESLQQKLPEKIKEQVERCQLKQRLVVDVLYKAQEEFDARLRELEEVQREADDLDKAVVAAREKLNKLKSTTHNRRKSIWKTVSDASSGNQVARAEDRVHAAVRRADNARNLYILMARAINAMVLHYYQHELPEILRYLDDDYYTTYKHIMDTYLNLCRNSALAAADGNQMLLEVGEGLGREYEEGLFLAQEPFRVSSVAGRSRVLPSDPEEAPKPLVLPHTEATLQRTHEQRRGDLAAAEARWESATKILANLFKGDAAKTEAQSGLSPVEQWAEVKCACWAARWDGVRAMAQIDAIEHTGALEGVREEEGGVQSGEESDDQNDSGSIDGDFGVDSSANDIKGGEEGVSGELQIEAEDDEETKLRKKQERVIKEIMATEETYMAALAALTDVFHKPLVEAYRAGRTLMTLDQLSRVFGPLTQLMMLSNEVMNELKKNPTVGGTAQAFIDLAPFLKLYSSFAQSFDHNQKLVLECRKQPAFEQWMKTQQQVAGGTFESFYITPVQRVPRYLLLIREVLRHTPETHPAYADLCKAQTLVASSVEHINEHVRRAENAMKVVEVSSRIGGLPPKVEVLIAGRSFVREEVGRVLIGSSTLAIKCYLFLFSDVLFIASPALTDKVKIMEDLLVYRTHIDIDNAKAMLLPSGGEDPPEWYQEKYPRLTWLRIRSSGAMLLVGLHQSSAAQGLVDDIVNLASTIAAKKTTFVIANAQPALVAKTVELAKAKSVGALGDSDPISRPLSTTTEGGNQQQEGENSGLSVPQPVTYIDETGEWDSPPASPRLQSLSDVELRPPKTPPSPVRISKEEPLKLPSSHEHMDISANVAPPQNPPASRHQAVGTPSADGEMERVEGGAPQFAVRMADAGHGRAGHSGTAPVPPSRPAIPQQPIYVPKTPPPPPRPTKPPPTPAPSAPPNSNISTQTVSVAQDTPAPSDPAQPSNETLTPGQAVDEPPQPPNTRTRQTHSPTNKPAVRPPQREISATAPMTPSELVIAQNAKERKIEETSKEESGNLLFKEGDQEDTGVVGHSEGGGSSPEPPVVRARPLARGNSSPSIIPFNYLNKRRPAPPRPHSQALSPRDRPLSIIQDSPQAQELSYAPNTSGTPQPPPQPQSQPPPTPTSQSSQYATSSTMRRAPPPPPTRRPSTGSSSLNWDEQWAGQEVVPPALQPLQAENKPQQPLEFSTADLMALENLSMGGTNSRNEPTPPPRPRPPSSGDAGRPKVPPRPNSRARSGSLLKNTMSVPARPDSFMVPTQAQQVAQGEGGQMDDFERWLGTHKVQKGQVGEAAAGAGEVNGWAVEREDNASDNPVGTTDFRRTKSAVTGSHNARVMLAMQAAVRNYSKQLPDNTGN